MPPPLPPAPTKNITGCSAILLVVAALMIGGMVGRLTAPSSSPTVTEHPRFLPAPSSSGAGEERAPVKSSEPARPDTSAPLPKGMSGFAKLTVDPNVITGKVVGVSDGDSLTLLTTSNESIKIRLEGIDAPESTQEYGSKAKQALSALAYGKTVTARISGKDRYDRTLAWVEVDGISINQELIARGWAWQYRQYNTDPDIALLQDKARTSREGLWAAPNTAMAPWEYRALGRSGTPTPATGNTSTSNSGSPTRKTTTAEVSGKGKFWINTNGVRHNSGCRWYGNTKRGHFSDSPEGRACGICGG